MLALPDPELPYEVVVDASDFGCGAVLLQKQRLVAFHSYKFGSAELNYPTGEKELLAVITALRQWRCHLEGAGKVVVVTDHKPNTFLDSKPYVQLSSRQVHWQHFLSRFDFTWEYFKGCANVADPVSRNPALLNAVIALSPVGSEGVPGSLLQRIRDGYASDKWFDNAKHTEQLTFAGGVWSKDSLVVVPDVDDLRQRCLSLHHDTPFAGHRDVIAPCNWCSSAFGGLVWLGMFDGMYQHVITVRGTNLPMRNLQGCCSLCLCLSSGGNGSLLILSRPCLRLRLAILLLLCLWTDFPRWCILRLPGTTWELRNLRRS